MLDFALSPLTWLFIGIVLWLLGRRTLNWLGGALAVVAVLMMTSGGANLLVWSVQRQVPDWHRCAAETPPVVVVLAAGFRHAPRDPTELTALTDASLIRIMVGAKLYTHIHGTRMIVVGGGDYTVPESVVAAGLARKLGIPADRISLEEHSRDTWQNAFDLRKRRPLVDKQFWLVTSALHLPRALLAFRAAGYTPCPFPAESYYRAMPVARLLLPRTEGLQRSEAALHELIGDMTYRWRLHFRKTPPPLDNAQSL